MLGAVAQSTVVGLEVVLFLGAQTSEGNISM